MKPYILYHGNCPDGMGAALAAFFRFGEDATYMPVLYGQPVPELEIGRPIYMLDFSYPRKTILELMSQHQIVILDHHATAEKELEGLPNATFDMKRSGAVMAWQYFSAEPIPEFFLYLQDRDLWKFELPMSREVSMAIRSYPLEFRWWVGKYENMEKLKEDGESCRRLTDQQVDNMTKNFQWGYFDIRGIPEVYIRSIDGKKHEHAGNGSIYVVPVVNASVFFSEVGERLLQLYPAAPFSAYWFVRADGKEQWGLRSREGFDCSAIAKAFGGGGHPQASGFIRKVNR